LSRHDLVTAHSRRLRETHEANRHIRIRQAIRQRFGKTPPGASA
jgi:hypothetical protein